MGSLLRFPDGRTVLHPCARSALARAGLWVGWVRASMQGQAVRSGMVPGSRPCKKVNKRSDFGWDLSTEGDRSYASLHPPRAWLLEMAGTKIPVKEFSVISACRTMENPSCSSKRMIRGLQRRPAPPELPDSVGVSARHRPMGLYPCVAMLVAGTAAQRGGVLLPPVVP